MTMNIASATSVKVRQAVQRVLWIGHGSTRYAVIEVDKTATARLDGMDSLVICKWFEWNPDFERARWVRRPPRDCESLKLRRLLLSTS
jgi:hypothetical protein